MLKHASRGPFGAISLSVVVIALCACSKEQTKCEEAIEMLAECGVSSPESQLQQECSGDAENIATCMLRYSGSVCRVLNGTATAADAESVAAYKACRGDTGAGGSGGTTGGGGAGGSASPDPCGAWCRTFEYAGNGVLPIRTEEGPCGEPPEACYDFSADGSGSIGAGLDCSAKAPCQVVSYDAATSRVLSWGLDSDCDGTSESCRVYTWGPEGEPKSSGVDANCDGSPESCEVYTGGGWGTNTWTQGTDSNCDGNAETDCVQRDRLVWVDIGDKAWSRGSETRDTNCDGVPESGCIVVLSKDASNHTGGFGPDENCDGQVDQGSVCTAIAFAASGAPTRWGDDTDCNGEADSDCRAATPDTYGHALLEGIDADCDGTVDTSCMAYGYQGELLVLLGEDTNCDGEADTGCMIIVRNGELLVRMDQDNDCDGVVDGCTVTRADAVGRVVEQKEGGCCEAP